MKSAPVEHHAILIDDPNFARLAFEEAVRRLSAATHGGESTTLDLTEVSGLLIELSQVHDLNSDFSEPLAKAKADRSAPGVLTIQQLQVLVQNLYAAYQKNLPTFTLTSAEGGLLLGFMRHLGVDLHTRTKAP